MEREQGAFRISIVLWSGRYGGAERWSLDLAMALTRQGHKGGVAVLGDPHPLCERLASMGLAHRELGLSRGSQVLTCASEFAAAVDAVGGDAAIVPSAGYLSAALRWGGYRGKIVAVEHGSLLQWPRLSLPRRIIRRLDWASGVGSVDIQVTPSDFMRTEVLNHRNCGRVVRIYPGLDLSRRSLAYSNVREERGPDAPVTFGCAGRLAPGKGIDTLVRAIARAREPVRVRVAGDGPERAALEELSADLDVLDRVEFLGWVSNMDEFWDSCDVAVVPSHQLVESFGMVAIEAMASGIPVLASRRGGLSEIVADGTTGSLFEPGDWSSLARLMDEYSHDSNMRFERGRAARTHCRERYDIDRCATEFMRLIEEPAAA